jgi:hypothetical protein
MYRGSFERYSGLMLSVFSANRTNYLTFSQTIEYPNKKVFIIVMLNWVFKDKTVKSKELFATSWEQSNGYSPQKNGEVTVLITEPLIFQSLTSICNH